MYGVQHRFYCGVCYKSVIPNNYPNYLKSQNHVINFSRNQYTNSEIQKTHYKKDK